MAQKSCLDKIIFHHTPAIELINQDFTPLASLNVCCGIRSRPRICSKIRLNDSVARYALPALRLFELL
jgi:hypothetical protein